MTFEEPRPGDRFDVTTHDGYPFLKDFIHPRDAHLAAESYNTAHLGPAAKVVQRKRFWVFGGGRFVRSFETHEAAQAWADQVREESTRKHPEFEDLYATNWVIQEVDPTMAPPPPPTFAIDNAMQARIDASVKEEMAHPHMKELIAQMKGRGT